ncbi:ABC-type cobalt transport system, permease component CbiQ [Desulfosporosinus acidiphilus SJ4]|uniref:ABC-type cobalt transport system, permease component CbiQ n=1 Tax=Desulfosporosinus acidiphilus (strain DSM 22704 / JCM 16185 / SJ4) TaxID=646529 RepID=I4D6F7_DESAJ|nr:energy-coupling factor transporter transmembrane component T [Desulfosporosinus acidiphilus]AFM41381.1 ABC-type cobalt transport system, permease component CbiQ [Desulfosporosinus acidiphilus SJ4]
MLAASLSENTLIHRLDVRSKMLCFLVIIILTFLFQNPIYQLAIILFTGLIALWINIPLRKILGLIVPLLPIVISITLVTGFSFSPQHFEHIDNRKILFYLFPGNHLGATVGGFLMGTTFLLRIWSLLIASSILTFTTSLEEFTCFFQWLKVPAEVSMILTTALRFIPTLDKKRCLILEAQMARGMNFQGKGIIGTIRSYVPVMVPLFINSIMMANTLSMAMLNRGYGLTRALSVQPQQTISIRDLWISAFILIVFVLALFVRFKLRLGIL